MPKAVSYIRFSTSSQASGSTSDRQKLSVVKWLERNPSIHLSDLSREDLGISGYKGKNLKHGLGEILAAIEERKIEVGDYLLIEALDRLGRGEPLKMINICEQIISSGIKVVTLEDNQVYSKETITSDAGLLQSLLGKIIQANNYSRQLSYRISEAYENKRIKAKSGEKIRIHNAYWLDKDGSVNPERGEHVKLCIDLYLKGYGVLGMFKEMVSTYPATRDIDPTTIKRWLKSPALIGTWWNKGSPIEGVFEPLIDNSTFIKLKTEMKSRRMESGRKGEYVLSGILKCRKCKKNYHFMRKEYKNDVIVYCHCSNFIKKGIDYCSNKKSWAYEVCFSIFEETLNDSLEKFTTQQITNSLSVELNSKIHERDELNKAKVRAYDIAMKFEGDNDFEMGKYASIKESIKKLNIEIESLELAIGEKSRAFLNDNQIRDVNILYEKLLDSPLELNSSLKKVGHQILVSNYSAIVVGSSFLRLYRVVKRSQRFKCYIVRKKVHKRDSKKNAAAVNIYYAVDRIGVISTAKSFSKLMGSLEEKRWNLINDPNVYEDDGYVPIENIYEWLHHSEESRDYDQARREIFIETINSKK